MSFVFLDFFDLLLDLPPLRLNDDKLIISKSEIVDDPNADLESALNNKSELFELNEVVDEPVLNKKPLAPVPIT